MAGTRVRQQCAQRLLIRARSRAATHGLVMIGGLVLRCALGRSGRRSIKREGDGATPIGHWPVRHLMFRRDAGLPPRTGITIRPIRPNDGWCDAPGNRNYNRPVRHPYPASAERLWRSDNLYDLVLVLGHNDRPRKRGGGSAIFGHLARPGYAPTEGCIALSRRDMTLLLSRLGRRSIVTVL